MRLLLLNIAAGLTLLAQPPLDWDATSPGAAQIDAYLRGKSSPMAGIGTVLENLGRQFSVDPRLIVAISGAETTFGKHVCADNNAWNWFHRGPCPSSTFVSYDEGLEHVTKFMRRSYLNKGYTTVPLIQAKYCASGCENWTPLVSRFQLEMPSAAPVAQPPVPTASPTGGADRGRVLGVPLWLVYWGGAIVAIGLVLRAMKRR